MYSKIELTQQDANMVERQLRLIIQANEEFVQCLTCKADWGKYGHAPGCSSTRAEAIISRIHEHMPVIGFKPVRFFYRWLAKRYSQQQTA